MPALLLTLPVRDPVATRGFFGRLGFRFDPEHSDGRAACMLVDRNIVVVFRADPRAGVDTTVADGAASGAGLRGPDGGIVACLMVDSPAEVDRLVAVATHAGGRVDLAPGLRGGAYGGSFTDPDGHHWELLCPQP